MKVLVTGGSGFIGSTLLGSLSSLHPDWELYNLDLRRPRTAPSTSTFLEADITSAGAVEAAILAARPDAIVHTAGLVPPGQERYSTVPALRAKTFAVNEGGTANILASARKANVKALVYTSSCTVVSDDLRHDYPLMHEELPTWLASTSYGASKAAAEALVLGANGPGLRTCALRPATVIGPGDSYGVIDVIMGVLANGETPWVIGGGDNLYDFVYIDNVVQAHVLALEDLLREETKVAGLAVFVSNHEPVYFRDFMEAVWALCAGHVAPYRLRIPIGLAWVAGLAAECLAWVSGRDTALSRGSVQDAVGTRYANNARSIALLGYRPKIGFAEGVRLACEDWKRGAKTEGNGIRGPN